MEAADFSAAWKASGDRLCRYPADAISASSLPANTKHFLVSAGLPQDAAPFLSFAPGRLDWLKQIGDDADRFYPVGSDGSGNPIMVDDNGFVWLVDHDTPSHRTLVNSSVPALAECLLAYRRLVAEAVAAGGEDAFLDGLIPADSIATFSTSINAIDSSAGDKDNFWGRELTVLLAEANR
jgi:hypothetical protein